MNDNRLRNHLLTCRSPRVIDNKRGVPVLSSCGRCPECMSRKSKRNTILALQESQDNRYCFFVTLTYNDACIPIVRLYEESYKFPIRQAKVTSKNTITYRPDDVKYISCVDYTRRKLHPKIKKSPYVSSKTYGEELFRLNYSFNNKLFKKYYKKSRVQSKIYRRKPFKYIPILCKEDVQKFLKRLRFQISKDFDTEIRYFACGEYGPQHFRPHYHLLLYFNEPRLQTELQGYINKCWQYGDFVCEPVLKRQGVASYASGYVNGTSNLPTFYYNKSVAPFVIHSVSFGALTNDEVVKYAKAFDEFPFDKFTISTSTGIRDISFQSKIKSYLFPRCYDYEHKVLWINTKLLETLRDEINPSTKQVGRLADVYNFSLFKNTDFYKVYNLYPTLQSKYGTTHLMTLARYFLLEEKSLHHLLDVKDDLDFRQYELVKDEIDDFHLSILMRVYTALLVSRRVLNNSIICSMPFHKYLYKIISFYNQLELYKLKLQYELQQEYHDTFCCDDYSIFYYLNKDVTKSYEERFEANNNIKHYKTESLIEIQNKVKHKDLNDENLIFNLL